MSKKQFIALAGNIGCGKTTAAKLISRHFGHELFDEPVVDNRFLTPYYSDFGRWSFTLQLEFLIKRVTHHELIDQVPKSCIQDRTLIEDPEIFAKYLHGLGHMTDNELELYFEYFERLNRGIRQPDKIICFQCSEVNVLMNRIRKRGRAEEQAIDPNFLEGLNGYYQAFPNSVRSKHKIDVMTWDVTYFNIHEEDQAQMFLNTCADFLAT